MPDKTNIIIAIDGHSGCGKSTLAKAIAKKLHILYVDSGAMYRAITWYCLENHIGPDEIHKIISLLDQFKIDITSSDPQIILMNGKDVSETIRKKEIADLVSQVSTISEVRAHLVKLQREIAKETSVIMDGRDIGTVVFPHAQVKIFVTASLEIRSLRRYKESRSRGEKSSLKEITANLIMRDHIDSTRSDSPLRKAEDAIELNNSFLSREEQLEKTLEIIYIKTGLKSQ
ncbi:MAG: (d)CMP kinase [Bacteroidota bacterium]|nr:(d)CMP kinase [Bacteroidota bacterium]